MSQLMDGELTAIDANRLQEYLETHPEGMDWMESADRARVAVFEKKDTADTDAIWQGVEEQIETGTSSSEDSKDNTIAIFPYIYKTLAAAAAIGIVATASWLGLTNRSSSEETFASNDSVVEFVDTEIPDASPMVYTDEESGWTVVWVAKIDPLSEDAG